MYKCDPATFVLTPGLLTSKKKECIGHVCFSLCVFVMRILGIPLSDLYI